MATPYAESTQLANSDSKVAGASAGLRLAGRVPEDRLRKAFGWFVLAMGAFVLVQQGPSWAALAALVVAVVGAVAAGFCLSFVTMTMKARIRGFDWTLEDAAMDLGSPPLRTFSKVTLPLITPGIVAAFMLSLALSIDDYIITSFVAGDVSTFPRQVWDSAKVAIPPHVHVLATMIMLVSIAVIVGGTLIGNRRAARGL